MTTRPTRIVQTSTEAKKLHKRNATAIPERQLRQLERGAELEKRAARFRDAEERRKAAKRKRGERERKEAEARRHMGVGLATQLIGYSRTQAQLKSGMEAFLGFKKRQVEERRKEVEVAKQLEALVEEDVKEPWDDDAAEEDFDLPGLDTAGGEQLFDDDLDDDTLLEIHDLVTSDPMEESNDDAQPAASTSVAEAPKCISIKESADYVRLHGPINKAIQAILDKLPEPLIELLSEDISTNPDIWDPAPSLLHKLNPVGLPPHRLHVKAGCVVTLLRELNSSSSLSKSQHLRVIRTEKDRLECLVLDGQLEGTQTFLTRVSFSANHRNDGNRAYQRMQFPIQVSKDWVSKDVSREMSQPTFKLPSIPGLEPSPSVLAIPKPKPHPNPSFKLPGLPASKVKSPGPSKPTHPPACSLLDGWDDFLDSGTQIARELSSEPPPSDKALPATHSVPSVPVANTLPPPSTQEFDFDFLLDDLDDEPYNKPPYKESKMSMPPPEKPRADSHAPPKPTKKSPFPRTDHPLTSKHKIAPPPPRSEPESASKRKMVDQSPASVPTKRVAFVEPSRPTAAHIQSERVALASKVVKPLKAFNEFGLSTQEAASFFEDDEGLAFGSPMIAV
ncbi:hypothetical protein K458DRAFT_447026 [Lentithecium fluviatile CBS 122367]|uniref:ATP-dependent DNA helicase n=1 Tax=Lentithecium fluviatile CBS 122367 TaxID=1168545 RepID=A0A6G1IGM0_9PLEO|nr:hypothetical protein K458DRAFT_447026 [Lentithecium fluviatile CBS 122367]